MSQTSITVIVAIAAAAVSFFVNWLIFRTRLEDKDIQINALENEIRNQRGYTEDELMAAIQHFYNNKVAIISGKADVAMLYLLAEQPDWSKVRECIEVVKSSCEKLRGHLASFSSRKTRGMQVRESLVHLKR